MRESFARNGCVGGQPAIPILRYLHNSSLCENGRMRIITLGVFVILAAAAMFIPAPKPASTVVAVASGDPPPLCPEFPDCGGN